MSTTPPTLPKKKSSKKTVLLIVFLGLIVLCVLIVIVSTNWAKTPEGQAAGTESAIKSTETALAKPIPPTKTQKATKTASATVTESPAQDQNPSFTQEVTDLPTQDIPTLTPTVVISTITFQEILDQYDVMTEAQWKDYKKSLNGTYVNWSGLIYDVSKTMGSYFVDACSAGYSCNDNIVFSLPKEEALQLNKQQQISFIGKIISIDDDIFGNVDVQLYDTVITSK